MEIVVGKNVGKQLATGGAALLARVADSVVRARDDASVAVESRVLNQPMKSGRRNNAVLHREDALVIRAAQYHVISEIARVA